MNESAPILVGDHVAITRQPGGAPVHYEGLTGRIVDHMNVGRQFLVDFDGDLGRKWYAAEYVSRIEGPARDDLEWEHIDAIEARVIERAKARRA